MKELISCIKNLPKHFKTSLVNLWRNGAMTFSSIFAVTITLLLIGVISVLALNVQDISANIEEGVRIYVKLERSIDENAENEVGKQIKQLKGVASATYFSKDEELSKLIDKQGEDGKELFESYRDDNPLGAAYEVEAKDPTKLASLAKKIKDIPNVNTINGFYLKYNSNRWNSLYCRTCDCCFIYDFKYDQDYYYSTFYRNFNHAYGWSK